jgi:hypothetical protein
MKKSVRVLPFDTREGTVEVGALVRVKLSSKRMVCVRRNRKKQQADKNRRDTEKLQFAH